MKLLNRSIMEWTSMKNHLKTERKRLKSRIVTSKTRLNHKRIKVLRITLNGEYHNCPAFDHEDIAFEKLGSHVRLGDRRETIREILTEKKIKKSKDPEQFILKTIRFLFKKFFEKVMIDVIKNDVVFIFPRRYAYIVAAQQSPTVKYYKYDKKHHQGRVMVMLVFSKQGFAISKGRRKYISLSIKFQKMLKEELDNGHIYPVIDEIINKMNFDGS